MVRSFVRPHVFFQRRAHDGSAFILIAWRQVPSTGDGGRHDKGTTDDPYWDRRFERQAGSYNVNGVRGPNFLLFGFLRGHSCS